MTLMTAVRPCLAVVGVVAAVLVTGCGNDDENQTESMVDEILNVESCDELFSLNEEMEADVDPEDFTPAEAERLTGAFEEVARRLECE